MTPQEIRDLADQAIDKAFLEMQERIGVDTGDVAGLYCSGNRLDALRQLFEGYIQLELSMKKRERVSP